MFSEIGSTLATIAWHFGPRGLNGECCEDLSMPEFIALDKVSATRNCSVQEVGRSLGFSKSGATRVVNRLGKKGYIKKLKSREDGRVCCIEPTDKGREMLRMADLRYQQQFEALLSRFPSESRQKIKEVFFRVAGAVKE
ncbi:MarR family 2-MHQ and catechol resistance regulon transcriptional repressor [Desulfosalsimonas propionicica]|uniref:MarR family 2-MHQ and catechol resistance regulon transcriptional repressor n=1 Tax=Desulfosalsimonas propionicica TaxID=332175 RepID=A0A7W0HL51_9BACT|nr:MarR family transcriptional regulator [Desulfosalsimonas propionicica]MBA2881898.1 MarR family 2-MHQ and catechol resistance regulon transcriptional repressor [Desulfosalsimonas propionicica]